MQQQSKPLLLHYFKSIYKKRKIIYYYNIACKSKSILHDPDSPGIHGRVLSCGFLREHEEFGSKKSESILFDLTFET